MSKSYYQGGHKATIGGVPVRMARKPGEGYKALLKGAEHGFNRVSKDEVLATEAHWAREQLEAMGAPIPAKLTEGARGMNRGTWSWSQCLKDDKATKVWNALCVEAYLEELAARGRPQAFHTDVLEEQLDMFGEPEALEDGPEIVNDGIVRNLELEEVPQVVTEAPAVITTRTHGVVTWRTNGGLQSCGPLSVSEGTRMAIELQAEGYRDAALRPLTDTEAAEFEGSRKAFQARLLEASRRREEAQVEAIDRPFHLDHVAAHELEGDQFFEERWGSLPAAAWDHARLSDTLEAT